MTNAEKLEANVAVGLNDATQRFRAGHTKNKKAVDFLVAIVFLSAIQGTLAVLREPGVTPDGLAEAVETLAAKLGLRKAQRQEPQQPPSDEGRN